MFEEAQRKLNEIAKNIYLEKNQNQPTPSSKEISRAIRTPDELKIDERDYTLVPEMALYGVERGETIPHFIPHQIEPMNDFYEGIKQIVTQIFKIEVTILPENMHEKDAQILNKIDVTVKYTKVSLKKPTDESGSPIYPNEAIRLNRTYSSEMYVDAEIKLVAYHKDGHTDEKIQKVKDQKLCRIPIAVKTELCHTYKKSRENLLKMREDPDDPGGHFIIEGIEWTIDSLENVEFGSLRVYKNVGYKNEFARGEFISKGGDGYENSDQFIIRLLGSGQLTIEICRANRIDSLKDVHIPFYVLYRAMGWSSDKDIIETILDAPVDAYSGPGVDPTHAALMRRVIQLLNDAYSADYEYFSGMRKVMNPDDVRNAMLQELIKREKFRTREGKKSKVEVDTEDYSIEPVETTAPKAVKQVNIKKQRKEVVVSEDNRKFMMANLQRYFDIHFLEHVGTTPGCRDDKLRELSNMILEVLLTALDANPQTGRDDYSTKRIHTNGKSLSKQFKALFNLSAIYNTRKAITKGVSNNPYRDLNLAHILSAQIYGQRFEQSLIKIIKQSKGTSIQVTARRAVTNRLSSQLLPRKSTRLFKIATQRAVTTTVGNATGASERSIEIRRYHNTGTGFIDPLASQEGQTVGTNKALALSCLITRAGDSLFIKEMIRREPEFTPLNKATPYMIYTQQLERVRVNGHCIGFVPDAYEFCKKYRNLRRQAKVGIDKYTTIVWNPIQRDVRIWVDDGRLVRPLIIVYNTWDDPEKFTDDPEVKDRLSEPFSSRPFKQGILLTPEDIGRIKGGQLILDDLIQQGVVEFITVAEQAFNCVLACGPEMLQKFSHNPQYRYTHLDFPQMMMGINTLGAVYPDHNQTPRNVFLGNQIKHTAGELSIAWPYRPDKNTYHQYVNEHPLVTTKTNSLVTSSGMNCQVQFNCYTGFNEEDSAITSQGAIDRGWCCVSKFTNYITERTDMKRLFKTPDASNTREMNSENCYSKLGPEGYVPIGTYVVSGDVLVAVVIDISADSKDKKYIYADRSLVYKSPEPGIVYNIIHGTKSDGTEFYRVCLRVIRKVLIGDKFSTRTGQKEVNGVSLNDSDLPFTEDGVSPTVIMNPHAIPTRMTCGDLFEKPVGNWAARKGTFADSTMFHNHQVESYCEELKKMGMDPYSRVKCYSGITGERIETPITMGVTYFQRLLKFVWDSFQSNSDGPLDPLTRQPVAGKARDGGLRIGEMEKDCIISHGALRFLLDKFGHHSDGHPIYVCGNCRQFAVVNHEKGIYYCKICKDGADIHEIMSCWAAKAVLLELQGMMIDVQLGLAPYRIDKYE
jgi:DNA-directed RNA polymerase II subunit RPB2